MYWHVKQFFTLFPHTFIKKTIVEAVKTVRENVGRKKDITKGTYRIGFPSEAELIGRLTGVAGLVSNLSVKQCPLTIKHFCEHRFDLLGSGWVRVHHGMKCRGLEGYRYDMGGTVNVDEQGRWLDGRINSSNLVEAQRIWKLVDPVYTAIDWQIDFKSGHRWSEKTWYRDIEYGNKPGVDVKVPWELARMQHLPQMALASFHSPEKSKERQRLKEEFRNQVLDFIATNPPRFGVNWACSMDVGIRAANWLMAYDLFLSSGGQFDEGFKEVFTRSIYEHGLHIITNLEWRYHVRGNHYLANIAALAFIAAYVPSINKTDVWLAFAVQEMIREVKHQFYPDGGNFEGSTAYHRLSAEIVYFVTALIMGLPLETREKLTQYDHKVLETGWGKPKLKPAPLPSYGLPEGSGSTDEESFFPAWYFERLERMAEFILDITKPNGHIPQIGDNDNGRFFKLSPQYEHMTVKQARETYGNMQGYTEIPDRDEYFLEDHLDCRHLVAAAYGMFPREDFACWLGGQEEVLGMLDCLIIGCLSRGVEISSQRYCQRQIENNDWFSIGTEEDFQQALSEMHAKSEFHVRTTEFMSDKGNLRKDINMRVYPDFGLYIYISPRLYMAIRCWPGRKPFHSGHMHDDQLSVELVIDGEELLSDPGTYIYTPLPEKRTAYRSSNGHNTACPGDESTSENAELFSRSAINRAHVIQANETRFVGSCLRGNNITLREILVNEKLVINDYGREVILNRGDIMFYSPGYGIVRKLHCSP